MNSALMKSVINHWLKPVAWAILEGSLSVLTLRVTCAIMEADFARRDRRWVLKQANNVKMRWRA
jgi:hypothetical protein